MKRDPRSQTAYEQDICVCGHDEDVHVLGFFKAPRRCKVCRCTEYRFDRTERRYRIGGRGDGRR